MASDQIRYFFAVLSSPSNPVKCLATFLTLKPVWFLHYLLFWLFKIQIALLHSKNEGGQNRIISKDLMESRQPWHFIYNVNTVLVAAATINFDNFWSPFLLSKFKEVTKDAATNKVRPLIPKLRYTVMDKSCFTSLLVKFLFQNFCSRTSVPKNLFQNFCSACNLCNSMYWIILLLVHYDPRQL